ncbi:MAG TPA: P-loop NTPase, partial [Acidimicrobiales bacterium]|nr:P-loop NTPase [Acidimicrobiales bacterium]
ELYELAMEAGVRRIVAPNAPFPELLAVVDDALDRVDRRRSNTIVDARDDAPKALVRKGRIITVLSPKGGAGKTTVATNLAAGLARVLPEQVAIIDLDLQFGDVADALFLSPTHSLLDVPTKGEVDTARIKLALTPTGHGLHALCAPDDPASGEEVSLDAAARAIDALAADLEFVVIDTGAGIDAAALTAVERSTDLVLVGSLDVPSIRSVRKLICALDQLGMTGAQRHVVLNRADSDVGITADEVASTLGMEISVQVPSSRSIPASINAGTPVVVAQPASAVARPLQQLVGLFVDLPEEPVKGRRTIRRRGAK